jgi:hypothetical protein
MQEGTSKTDEKDAYSVFDLLRQGKCFLPVARAPELKAAYHLMQHHRALKKRGRQLRHQLRAALHLAVPALNPLLKDLTQPTALRFRQTPPTPAAGLSNSRTGLLEQWQLRRHCGQWRSAKFHTIDDLAQDSLGLTAPYRLEEFESKALSYDLADALARHHLDLGGAVGHVLVGEDMALCIHEYPGPEPHELARDLLGQTRDVEETAQQGIALQGQERVGDRLPFGHLDMHDGRDMVKKCGA